MADIHLPDETAANIWESRSQAYVGYAYLRGLCFCCCTWQAGSDEDRRTCIQQLFPKISGKERFKSAIYLVFYVCRVPRCLRSIYRNDRKNKSAVYKVMKTIHIQPLYYSLSFIFLHLAGLVLAELGPEKGIISRMIHGRRD